MLVRRLRHNGGRDRRRDPRCGRHSFFGAMKSALMIIIHGLDPDQVSTLTVGWNGMKVLHAESIEQHQDYMTLVGQVLNDRPPLLVRLLRRLANIFDSSARPVVIDFGGDIRMYPPA